ncbi:ABC transporter ATP-binding protein [Pseudobacteriovorax antillogorgiicola]|uniref:Capsular polysaccharide transport system ATP-binding protein n=1 Tax=Pseudobacteriovorax antillogorgiicola TaxID=1513793 RepID=A0A1Y6C0S5_9BACT|nr:ABC transporter ATP-binding protein [Pseudobacteriovorax antillogorgiicola]TCS50635.1 capsular polysaccharide transport system ATP-binding protein [Pseudobacteriovorax antillogorgiicola]SMF39516.1 capsular polysaccharide transport system ATP-binding protein [Pseudobacteriovorax antillogorgiicola]
MIELKNVTKSYATKRGRKYALRNVSFKIPTNASVGILGRNGAGKSTLLRLIGKIDYPDRGLIQSSASISWPVGLGAFQGSMTARENTRFVCRIHGVEDAAEVERQVAEFADIGDYFDMPIQSYSSGMRSRFSFGLSMSFRFDVYLVDEVTAVGDKNFRAKCSAAMTAKQETSSFIMVSHNLNELIKHCEVGLLLNDGQLTYYDDIREAVASYKKMV